MSKLSEKSSSEAVAVGSGKMPQRTRTPTEKGETTNVAESTLSDCPSANIMKDIEKFEVAETAISDIKDRDGQLGEDPNIVWWDSEDDPANPLNWTPLRKWTNIILISIIVFIVPLASSMFAPGASQVASEFGENNDLLVALVVSIYVIGLAVGPLVQAPLSEVYGRWVVYVTCDILYIVFTIACAVSSNMSMLIVFRFFAGCMGSAPLTIGGGSVADLFLPLERGRALSVYSLGPVVGPAIGPIAGGFLSESEGWRWIFWVLTIASGVVTVGQIFLTEETNAVVILERKVKRLQKETGNMNLRSKLDRKASNSEVLKRAIVRPAKLQVLSPISILMSVATAVLYGNLYLMLTTITTVFETNYGFTTGTSGLAYIGLGMGNIIGLFIFSSTSDRHLQQKSAKGLQLRPEDRLPLMLGSCPVLAAGMFWYGWSVQAGTHWIIPIIGCGVVSIGNIFFFMPMIGYLVDTYTIYAASALAANTVLRSIGGGLLPLAGEKMYAALGYGWGNSLLGFILIGFTPVIFIIYRYGEYIRTRWQINLD